MNEGNRSADRQILIFALVRRGHELELELRRDFAACQAEQDAMANEDNPINRMQEWLQAHCPVNNCALLWRGEDEARGSGFRVRIVLVNTGPASDQDMRMPWSAVLSRKMDAKKDAARVCLEYLIENGLFPHDPSRVPLAVGVVGCGGGGGSGVGVSGSDAVLPDLVDLLDVEAVIMRPEPTGAGYSASRGHSDESEDDEEVPQVVPRMTTMGSSSRAPPPGPLPPANLGLLGEEYALQWLSSQPWVAPGSVSWENALVQAATRDIRCLPIRPPGRSHVEVKTRWRRFKKAGASRAQRARLLNPEDDYMLLIVGFFENLYPPEGTAARPPSIRILPNARWEDMEIGCSWCNDGFVWSVAEQQSSGAERPHAQRPPALCRPCSTKLDRTGGKLRASCEDCGKPWVYEAGEQKFIEKKGLSHPKRCKLCRSQAKAKRVLEESLLSERRVRDTPGW